METIKEAVRLTPVVVQLMRHHIQNDQAHKLGCHLTYQTCHPTRKRRKLVDNLGEFARQWKEVMVKLATSHSKEGIDQADYKMDDLFNGLIAMPVKQVREFYDLLLSELKSDEHVPYFIWKTVETWKETAVGVSQETEAKMLQAEMAGELANMLEPALQPQLKQALADSLKWKSSEVLEKIRGAVSTGSKPSLRGRESCLFLEVGGNEFML
jgi:uncharacterized protein (DUF2267 family)